MLLQQFALNAAVQEALIDVAEHLPHINGENEELQLELEDMRLMVQAIIQHGGVLNQHMIDILNRLNEHLEQHG
jgi:hypothetical protein